MAKSNVMIIGPGALGKALGFLFFRDESVQFWGRTSRVIQTSSGKKAEVHCIQDQPFFKAVHQANVIVISTIDAAVKEMVQKIEPFVQPGQFIIHVSGSLNSALLSPLEERGAKIGVFHLLQTFHQDSYQHEQIFRNASASFVGDESVLNWLKPIAEKEQIFIKRLIDEQKKQLHIAAVFVCNFQHVLFDAAFKSTELPEQEVVRLLQPLINQTMDFMTHGGVMKKLSGPVKRGDWDTVKNHLKTLQDKPLQQDLYHVLSQYLKTALEQKDVR
ncbi:DUF2520 domain-containing protein [bacterium]|nr:MAG: DUF2520 domain-containing protein [bacterium]